MIGAGGGVCGTALTITQSETQPQLQPALLRLSAMISQYFIRVQESPPVVPKMTAGENRQPLRLTLTGRLLINHQLDFPVTKWVRANVARSDPMNTARQKFQPRAVCPLPFKRQNLRKQFIPPLLEALNSHRGRQRLFVRHLEAITASLRSLLIWVPASDSHGSKRCFSRTLTHQ